MKDEEFIKKLLEISNFKELNPVQKEALKKGLLKGKNLVISAPTASGKTFCAELAAIKTILEKKEKVIYMVPLVALANEKYEELKKKYSQLGVKVALSVGELDSADPFLRGYHLIVVSNEKMDSLIRHGADWISDIGLIIADEVHLLNQADRGPTLEITLTLLRRIVPRAQILALSATIKNAEELAKWLNADTVISEWRPVKLYKGVAYPYKIKLLEKEGYELDESLPLEVSVIKNTLELRKQVLFFVATRKSAESLAEKLGKVTRLHLSKIEKQELGKLADEIEGVLETPTKQCRRIAKCIRAGAAFHHAGLLYKQKSLIEENFRKGLIKVIVATPTLAYGVNLPSFRVIMRDLKRYYPGVGAVFIPILEVQQMLGRCISGDTFIFTRRGPITLDELASRCTFFKNGEGFLNEPIEILSIDMRDAKLTFSKVLKIWRRKVTQTLLIETRSGKRIRVTPEHEFLVFRKISCGKASLCKTDNTKLYKKVMELRKKYGWGPSRIAHFLGTRKVNTISHWLYDNIKPRVGCFLWKKAKKLKGIGSFGERDYIACALNFNFVSDSKPTNFLPFDKLVYKGNNTYMTKQGHKKCNFPAEWSAELCRFIAKIMADGSIYYDKKSNSYQIAYWNKDREAHEDYARLVYRLFNKKVKIDEKRYRGSYRSVFKAFLVGIFLKNIGIPCGRKARILRVPRVLFSLPKLLIKVFLKEYLKCNGQEDQERYWITTSSEKLIYDFALLLASIGLVARVFRKKPNKFRKTYSWELSIPKSQFDKWKKLACVGNVHPDLIKKIKILKGEEYVYDLTLNPHHNFIANGLVIHNCGRPQYDSFGEGIILAKSEEEAEEIIDYYIHGEVEDIKSKLALEPVLRMHTLALIASDFCKSEKALLEFFSETFYGYQYGELSAIEERILDILDNLIKWKFVERKKDKLEATMIGRRVSELYIDPLTAHHFVNCLTEAAKREIQPFSFLQAISNTIEMQPLLNIRTGEFSELNEIVAEREELLLQRIPEEWNFEFDNFLRSVKTALMFEAWINEATEDYILEKFKVAPGEFYGRREIADWLIYSLHELALLLGYKELLKHIRKLRVRVKYGVKEELIPLVRLRNIGRIRARQLYSAGLTSLQKLREIPLESLSRLIGPKIAYSIKEQLGQIKKKPGEEEQASLKRF